MAGAKHLLRYLKGTPDHGPTYGRPADKRTLNRLYGFTDSDWAADPDTRRSVGAFVLFLNGAPVAWRSKLQPSVALSTCEAEYMAASKAGTEVVWLRRLLAGLGFPQLLPTVLYEDNQAAIQLAANPVHKDRTKHIDMRRYALREFAADGVLQLVSCPTQDMAADALTKALPGPVFLRHRSVLLGSAPHTAPHAPVPGVVALLMLY
mmetsp:Transcript_28739/g.67115  ORF Transcript_28739/g.67115 Transcript_28739/m.67115 type:complete len:206 (-) Transcript_28739:135-752(-)